MGELNGIIIIIIHAFITCASSVTILNKRSWQSLGGSTIRVLMGYLKNRQTDTSYDMPVKHLPRGFAPLKT